ncbi:8641_t:CDS:2, partial [Gigaspora margarita]
IDYQLDKIRLDVEIKKLFQKKEQEIVEIWKNSRTKSLKRTKQSANINRGDGITKNKQKHKPAKQTTINRNKSAHCQCKHKLEARELQEEILEKESPTDIKMSEKEEVSPGIADATNEVEVLQDRLQSMPIQEESKKNYPIEVDCSIYDKVR